MNPAETHGLSANTPDIEEARKKVEEIIGYDSRDKSLFNRTLLDTKNCRSLTFYFGDHVIQLAVANKIADTSPRCGIALALGSLSDAKNPQCIAAAERVIGLSEISRTLGYMPGMLLKGLCGSLFLDASLDKAIELVNRGIPLDSKIRSFPGHGGLNGLSDTILGPLQDLLGYQFKNRQIISSALTRFSAEGIFLGQTSYLIQGAAIVPLIVGMNIWTSKPILPVMVLEKESRTAGGSDSSLEGEFGISILNGVIGRNISPDQRALRKLRNSVIGAVYADGGILPAVDIARRVFPKCFWAKASLNGATVVLPPPIPPLPPVLPIKTNFVPEPPEDAARSSQNGTVTFQSLGLSPKFDPIFRKRNWPGPTEIQEKAVPSLLTGANALVLAQTGRGKTLAYLLPILQAVKNAAPNTTSAVVIVPTSALATQVFEEAKEFGASLGVTTALVTEAAGLSAVTASVNKKPSVVIGTPAMLRLMVEIGNLVLDEIKIVAIDEPDQMLQLVEQRNADQNLGGEEDLESGDYAEFEGRSSIRKDGSANFVRSLSRKQRDLFELNSRDQVEELLELLPPADMRQNVWITASVPRNLEPTIAQYLPGGKILDASYETPLSNLTHKVLVVDRDKKTNVLHNLLVNDKDKRFIVALDPLDTQFGVIELIAKHLGQPKDSALTSVATVGIHRGMPQAVIERNVIRFKKGECRVLVADASLLRGLDIEKVEHVVIYDLMSDPLKYRQAAGRVGRGPNSTGTVTNIVLPFQKNSLKELLFLLGVPASWDESLVSPNPNAPNALDQKEIRTPEQLVWYIEDLFDCKFEKPALLLAGCWSNKFNPDPRLSRGTLNPLGRYIYKLAVWELLQSNAPTLGSFRQKEILKTFESPGEAEKMALLLGFDRFTPRDHPARIRDAYYCPNTAQNLFNVCGALFLDGKPLSVVRRIVEKYQPKQLELLRDEQLANSYKHLSEGKLEVDDDTLTTLLDVLPFRLTHREMAKIVFQHLDVDKGSVRIVPQVSVVGELVYQLSLCELLRRARGDTPTRVQRQELHSFSLTERIRAVSGMKEFFDALQDTLGWKPAKAASNATSGPETHLISNLIGAHYLEHGMNGVFEVVSEMFPDLIAEAIEAEKATNPLADLQRLQAAMVSEGEALLRRREGRRSATARK